MSAQTMFATYLACVLGLPVMAGALEIPISFSAEIQPSGGAGFRAEIASTPVGLDLAAAASSADPAVAAAAGGLNAAMAGDAALLATFLDAPDSPLLPFGLALGQATYGQASANQVVATASVLGHRLVVVRSTDVPAVGTVSGFELNFPAEPYAWTALVMHQVDGAWKLNTSLGPETLLQSSLSSSIAAFVSGPDFPTSFPPTAHQFTIEGPGGQGNVTFKFNGGRPSQGNAVWGASGFITDTTLVDPNTAVPEWCSPHSMGLIGFFRESSRLYTAIPESVTSPEAPEFQAYLESWSDLSPGAGIPSPRGAVALKVGAIITSGRFAATRTAELQAGRRIEFVLDADPWYLVFTDADEFSENTVHTIRRKTEGGFERTAWRDYHTASVLFRQENPFSIRFKQFLATGE
jgi:hypothetical protein